MSSSLRPFLDRWPLCALLVSAAMLAIAHAFQTFGHMAPCELCLKQRTVYWVAGGVALAAMILLRLRPDARLRQASDGLLALVFLTGAGIAAYHAGVEWKFWPGPQSCTGAGTVDLKSMQDLLAGKVGRIVRCDEPAWVFLGVSMAGWNALASLVLAALSIAAAMRERTRA
ncbi:MAG: disulfide bond formation protein B [Phenylobacterium sp.]